MPGADYNPFPTWQPGFETWPAEIRARVERVYRRAEEVFGNRIDAGVWMSGFNPRIRGGWQIRDNIKTEEGAADALAELDRIAPTITPQPLPPSVARPRRRR